MIVNGPLKKRVIKEAKKYIAEHQYVHINWLIRTKLGLKVKDSFIASVIAQITKTGFYLKTPVYKNDFKIEKNPLYNWKSILRRFFWTILIGIISSAVAGYLIYKYAK